MMKYSSELKCNPFELFAPTQEYEIAASLNIIDNEIRESKVDYMDEQDELMKTKKDPPEVIQINLTDDVNRDSWE